MNDYVAIIPARGGSKRLPRKNILPLKGRPMLSYPVTAALESGLFSQVVVTTEDEEIAEVARAAGARVMQRPDELATDQVQVTEVCVHTVRELGKEGPLPEAFCCLYATAAFITPEQLRESAAMLDRGDVVMGVARYNYEPVRALQERNGRLGFMWPEYVGRTAQECPDLVVSCGTLYWLKIKPFLAKPTFYPDKLVGYEVPNLRAVDMDTPDDFQLAELIAEKLLP